MKKRILVACEFSGVVASAFARIGWDAWSCDILPAEHDGQHIQGDVLDHLDEMWDMMIAHPPCTHLSSSGARWFPEKRADGRQQRAIKFVRDLMRAPIPRIAVENPVGVLSSSIRKPDQIIQPWMFGHRESKKTCLWLKGLPPIVPTMIVQANKNGRYDNQTPSGQNKLGPSADRWKMRSLTYTGFAQAMAEQWGCIDDSKEHDR